MTSTYPFQHLPYREGVGMLVLNKQNQVFLGQRFKPKSVWQLTQGGIDGGETPHSAALRELKEEIGTDHVACLAESKTWYYYNFPEKLIPNLWGGAFQGQRQKWFLFRFLGEDIEINLHTHHPEFQAWKWADPEEALRCAAPFKKALYEKVFQEFKVTFEESL